MFSVGLLGVCRPLIRAVEFLDEPFGQQPLEVADEDDVVLAMEVDPAVVAVVGVVALSLTGRCAVENLVKRLLVDIPQYHVKVLAERNVTIAMHNEAAHDTLTTKPKMSVSPFVIECHEVVILLRVVDALGNLLHKIRCCQQFARRIEEGHCAVDANANVYAVMLGNVYHIRHIVECVPRRQTEHQRQWHFVFECFHDFYHTVVPVAPPHSLISLAATVERDVKMTGLIATDGINNTTGRETIR